MRILGIVDVHGAHRRVAEMMVKEPDVDLVVFAGDLTTNGRAHDARAVLDAVGARAPRVFAVAGNMDPHPVEELLAMDGIALNGRGVVVGDVGFLGSSGAPLSPLHTPNEVPEEELAARLAAGWRDVRGARWKVLVSHAPPLGTRVDVLSSGAHVGSSAVRAFCDSHQPDLVLCGQIHEARGVDRLGRTILVNPGPAHTGAYCVIAIDEAVRVVPGQL